MNEKTKEEYVSAIETEYQILRDKQVSKTELLSLDDAKSRKPKLF